MEHIRIEKDENVAIMILAQTETRNALNEAFMAEIQEALTQVEQDDSVRRWF